MSEGRRVIVQKSEQVAEEYGADEAFVAQEVTEEEFDEIVEHGTESNNLVTENPTTVEDLPDNELIWPDGPTAGQIKLWKKEFGDVYVTSITFDKHIAWRTLSRLEYKSLVRKMEQLMEAGQLSSAEANLWNEEAIAEICVLFPQYDRQSITADLAGLPSLIAQEVLEASGFVALEVRQL
jgi:hypothetical protein